MKSKIIFDKIETVYVEGAIDKIIIEAALSFYFPGKFHEISIETLKYGAGSSWVERQLFIWAKSLNKKNSSANYLKALGIFDDDIAGNEAIKRLGKIIVPNSAESKTYSILKISYKFSPILKSIRAKGINLSTTIEDLIQIDCWKIAKKNNWLQIRELESCIIEPILTDRTDFILNKESLSFCGFTDEEILIILYKVKKENKKDFCSLACEMMVETNGNCMISIKYLIQEIFEKLGLSDPVDRSVP